MDKLSNYIQNGKKMGINKATVIFAVISLIIGGICYSILTYVTQSSDFQKFLNDIPNIEIKDGQVVSPTETVWKSEIPYTNIKFIIDTSRDELHSLLDKNAFYLAKTKYYLSVNGEIQEAPISDKSAIINGEIIKERLPYLIRVSSITIGIITLIFFWLGYIGTVFLTYILSRIFKKNYNTQIQYRAAFIGWMGISILNFILHIVGYGFNGLISIILATMITVFALNWISGKN